MIDLIITLLIIVCIIVLKKYSKNNEHMNNDILSDINIYVINVKSSDTRLVNIDNEFKKYSSLFYNRFPAYNGKYIDEFVINFIQQKNGGMTRGMIGCYLSHCHLWLDLLDSKTNETMLILEDDIKLCDDFYTKLKTSLDNLPEDWDILLIGRRIIEPEKTIKINEHIGKLNSLYYGTHGYFINSKTVEKIKDITKLDSMDSPFDIKMSLLKDRINIYLTNEELVTSHSHEEGNSLTV